MEYYKKTDGKRSFCAGDRVVTILPLRSPRESWISVYYPASGVSYLLAEYSENGERRSAVGVRKSAGARREEGFTQSLDEREGFVIREEKALPPFGSIL